MTKAALRLSGWRYIAQRAFVMAAFSALLFAAAGDIGWTRGWAYLAVVGAAEAATLALLAVRAPETLNERGAPHAGFARFDAVFIVAWLALSLATAAAAGWDVRRGAAVLPWSLFALSAPVLVLASAFGAWAMLENEHFEQFVRIQADRGHRVVDTGPYRVVRHPGYLGAIIGALATPLALGTPTAFVPAALVVALFLWRTGREDATLREHLDGYADYARRTRWRLVPRVW